MPDSSRRADLIVLATLLAVAAGILLVVLLRPGGNAPADPTASPTGSLNGSPTGSSAPTTPLPSDPGETAVLLAVGDVSTCDSQDDEAVAALAATLPGPIALLGDLAYEDGAPGEFSDCFAPAWGPMLERLRPAPGNHEYESPDAAPYFEFFGAAAGTPGEGWYSYDLGTWHVIALNSNCEFVGGCDDGSPQHDWLAADLAAHPTGCLLAYWHHPRYSSGRHGSTEEMEQLWATLVNAGMDVALAGHDHTYERVLEGRVREFVVGTGGRSHYPFEDPALPTTEIRHDDTFGVLSLTLGEGRYDWQFVPVGLATFVDSGTGDCG